MIEIISTYLLPVLLLGTMAYLLRVLAKIHANAKSIDSPDSIIQQLKSVQAELATLRRATETGHRDTVSSVIRLQDEGFRKLVDDSLKRSETSAGIQGNLARLFGEQATRFAEIEAILGAIREQASNADQQLRRFQDGYHWTINKSLILGILRVLDEIREHIESERNAENPATVRELEFVRDHLEILLGNEGIVANEPTIGDAYTLHRGTAKAIAVPTQDRTKDNTIAVVIRPGYVCDTGAEPPPLVRPAEVKVFRYQAVEAEMAQ